MRSAVGTLLAVMALLAAAGCDDGGTGGPLLPEIRIGPERGATPGEDGTGPRKLVDSGCEGRDRTPARDNLDAIERATLCLVNAERRDRGRRALRDDPDLALAARRKSRDMVRGRYFAHVGPDGRDARDWVKDTGYAPAIGGYLVGENLGWASGDAATPERLVLGWMRSPGHRENLLRQRFEHSGIGVALGAPREEGGGGATYTHMLGARIGP